MDRLRPMFPFYGSKWRAAPKYPPPRTGDLIIEPFAGSASYSLFHHKEHKVHLNDVDPTIAGIWRYLIDASPEEIRKLPTNVNNTDELNMPQSVKDLIGFWFTKATPVPAKEKVGWARNGGYAVQYWSEGRRDRIADQVRDIEDWKITSVSYKNLGNPRATWFVDPPYEGVPGRSYKHNQIDYAHLLEWCKDRIGQVIICENKGATWLKGLKHHPLGKFKTVREKKSTEIYCHLINGKSV